MLVEAIPCWIDSYSLIDIDELGKVYKFLDQVELLSE